VSYSISIVGDNNLKLLLFSNSFCLQLRTARENAFREDGDDNDEDEEGESESADSEAVENE
jgi:hypothetical protein